MQPFPTAFWKKTAEPVIEEVSCFTPVNSEDINGDGVYILQTAQTPDNEGEDGIGIYRDFNEQTLHSNEGFPVTHKNRGAGFNPANVIRRGARFENWEKVMEEISDEEFLRYYVLRNWVYIWREAGIEINTKPITITNSEDCKTSTIKCYFAKDATQHLAEREEHYDEEDINYFNADNNIVKAQVEGLNFNGYYEYEDPNPQIVHYPYRQKAKVRIKFNTGGQNLTVKIKGLGTDDNTRYPVHFGNEYKFDLRYTIDMGKALQTSMLKEEYENSRFNTGYGDLQSCEIFLNGNKQIKCIAPMLGYFTSYPAGVGNAAMNANYAGDVGFDSFDSTEAPFGEQYNIYKGPVRIFHQSNGKYVGVGSGHPINGLGYIDSSKFSAGYPDSEYDLKNPYGSDYLPNDSIFYDAFSNVVTPDYASPYQYTKEFTTSNGLGSGDQTIDIVFDSVTELFNGGAYYEIELSYT